MPRQAKSLFSIYILLHFFLLSSLHAERSVTLSKAARKYGFYNPEEKYREIRYTHKEGDTLIFRKNSPLLKYNGILIWLNQGTYQKKETWRLPQVEITKVLDPLMRPKKYLKKERKNVIVLDAGHGGKDPGALSKEGIQEKDVALQLAKISAKKLQRLGYQIVMTRNKDIFIPLNERSAIAARTKGRIFVSIHLNKAKTSEVRGIETFILSLPAYASSNEFGKQKPSKKKWPGNKYDKKNIILAHAIHKSLLYAGSLPDRGVKKARFEVLRKAPCPAVLVELGFLSNPKDVELFQKETFLQYLAQRLVNGIHEYASMK